MKRISWPVAGVILLASAAAHAGPGGSPCASQSASQAAPKVTSDNGQVRMADGLGGGLFKDPGQAFPVAEAASGEKQTPPSGEGGVTKPVEHEFQIAQPCP